jgi:hypothetical protein
MAHRLLKNPVIAKELHRRTEEIAEKTDVTIEEVIRELRKYAFDKEYKASNSERLKALELLGKNLCMFSERHLIGQDEQPEAKPLSEEEKQMVKQVASELVLRRAIASRPLFDESKHLLKDDTGKHEPDGSEVEEADDQMNRAIGNSIHSNGSHRPPGAGVLESHDSDTRGPTPRNFFIFSGL